MKYWYLPPLIMIGLMGWALFFVNLNYHPLSDKSYWSGFRAGLEHNCSDSEKENYDRGYREAMGAKK